MLTSATFRSPRSIPPMYVRSKSHRSANASWETPSLCLFCLTAFPNLTRMSSIYPCASSLGLTVYVSTDYEYHLLVMPFSSQHGHSLRLVRSCAQWIPKARIDFVPTGLRGIYALHRYRPRIAKYDVVYVGMADGEAGIRARLKAHANSKRKRDLWTHFSAFIVWPNITEAEITELEGLFREIYRKDKRANALNRQRRCRQLQNVRTREWLHSATKRN
jgi:hypothetical protein